MTLAAVALSAVVGSAAAKPLAKHPSNPSYLSFRGKAAILVGSGEHYGAVVNPDFDQKRYLDTLAADGLDLTRLFVGTYYEKSGDFGIAANTLAPAPAGRSCPGRGATRREPRTAGRSSTSPAGTPATSSGSGASCPRRASAASSSRSSSSRRTTARAGPARP